jgi:hypothetical protein
MKYKIFGLVVFLASVLFLGNTVFAKSDKAEKIHVIPNGNKVKVTDISEDSTGESYETDELDVDLNTTDEDNELEESTDSGETVQVRAQNNATYVIQNKLAAKTNFPLQVNYNTGELIVTTPKGTKVVTVLPEAAIQHMLAANVLDQLGGKGGYYWEQNNPSPTATASGEPSPTSSTEPSASPSSTPLATEEPAEQPAITLTVDENGNLVYEVMGTKTEKFLGLVNVKLHRVAVVSAETGGVVEIKQNLLNKLLDSLSF